MIKDGLVIQRMKELNETEYIKKPANQDANRFESNHPSISIKNKGSKTPISGAVDYRTSAGIHIND